MEFHLGKKLGLVADFCPMCREITAHGLHQAIITQGKLESSGHGLKCSVCGFSRLGSNSEYVAAVTEPGVDLELLIARTNPAVRQKYAPRLFVEEQVKDGRVEKGVREDLIREPLQLLAPIMENPPGGERVGCTIAGGVGLFAVLLAVSAFIPPSLSMIFAVIAFFILLVSLVMLVFLAIFSPVWRSLLRKRYLRAQGYPLLGRALGPLNPSEDELRKEVEGMISLGVRVVRHLDLGQLRSAIEVAQRR